MLKKFLLGLTVALLWLALIIYVQQHTNKQETEPAHEERVEVVRQERFQEDRQTHQETTGDAQGGILSEESKSRLAPKDEIVSYIKEIFGDGADWAIALSHCESGLSPTAVSPSGKYIGLYQFDNNTFNSNCHGDIYDWKSQVRCTKKLIDRGEYSRWPNCPK